MKITVSGTAKEVKDGLTLPDKESTVLKDGDSVEFLYFMGGGSYGVN